MGEQKPTAEPAWQSHLEVIGPEIFLAYRKCLMHWGISWTIWKAYPALSLPDVMCRVHAGRQLLRSGEDFTALAAIRRGRWQEPGAGSRRPLENMPSPDRVSRAQVRFGGLIALTLAVISLVAASGGVVALLPLVVCLVTGIGLVVAARYVRRLRRRLPHACKNRVSTVFECSSPR